MLAVERGADGDERLTLLVHLMSAGRLQLFDKRASLQGPRSRVLIRLADGRELRLREFGTKQRPGRSCCAAGDVVGRGDGRHPRPRRLAGAAARAARRADRPAAPPAPAAARPADDRRHRPLLGGRDPLGGAALAVQEGLRAATPRRSSGCTRRSHVLGDALDHYEEVDRRDGPRQAADAAAGAPPRGRALPALRRRRSRRSSTPSTDHLLPARADRRPGARRTAGSPGY